MKNEDAQTRCKSDASFLHLPVPKNEAENYFFAQLTSQLTEERTWIGLNRNDDGQNWTVDCSSWSTADTCKADLFTYRNWLEQPIPVKE